VIRQLLLLRHGRTAYNATRRFQGHLDRPLDGLGEEQADRAADLLAPLKPVALLSSDLLRAVATAAPLAAATGLAVEEDERLREIHLGHWQGLTMEDATERFPLESAAWQRGEDVRRGAGETYAEVAQRALAALRERLSSYDDGLAVVVTHGGTARAVTGGLLGLPAHRWSLLGPLGNCRWSLLADAGERGWRLLEHNSGAPELRL